MTATIAKCFTFDAAHFLPNVPAGHKCSRMHGHTYEVEIVLRGPIDDGFVADYALLDEAWAPIFSAIDHRVLNEISGLEVPSTEHLAAWMFAHIVDDRRQEMETVKRLLAQIRIRESSSTWCEISARDWLAGSRG